MDRRKKQKTGYVTLVLAISLLLLSFLPAHAEEEPQEQQVISDTLRQHRDSQSLWDRLYDIVKEFSKVDTRYIEPQHYNYTFMIQNTNTYESYTLSNKAGQEVVFAPEPSFRFGPYFGWRWLFLGYTFDISHLSDGHRKQDWDVSLYSNQVGVDLFYRKTGNGYKIRRCTLSPGTDASVVRNIPFDGFNASIKGFNLYYIFNHKKFSYPAAFGQSTCQKISCGSPLIGVGYMKHSIQIDGDKLNSVIVRQMDSSEEVLPIDSTFSAAKVDYSDFSISAGYAYNWVFARDWIFAVSLSAAIGHKHSTGNTEGDQFRFREFSFQNFALDGVGRFGVVWNNTRWFAGMSTIVHSYKYSKSQFSTNTLFGSANLYVGYNFGQRHRKKSASRQ